MTHGAARGRLVVLAGPSGVGKSTVVNALRGEVSRLYFSVSATTRSPRPGEVDGRDYRFVSASDFDRMVEEGALLEWAEIHGGLHRSGTPAGPVEEHLAAGDSVLVEVDLTGARNIRACRPDALLVFLAPPSWDDLVRRLSGRGTDSPEVIERRLTTAREELAAADEFDVTVVNDDLNEVVRRLIPLLSGAPDGEARLSH
ncbi:guanylate kinase [Pseudonocardia eucalypti]|uniref:Guanylate kinase n=1 Tax=Pseudonocardia eucalypti TaxID=648755 RepID=A0ABP9RC39_9PSEU|nr:guanylate kinase [Pseudonocardia eucalypti]